MELKHKLMDEFFLTGGNQGIEKFKDIEAKLRDYLKKNGADDQIRDVLFVIKAAKEDYEFRDFDSCRKIVAPIMERLSYSEKWDFYDIRILAASIQYMEKYYQIFPLAEEALKQLEDYSHEEAYGNLKVVIRLNILIRLIRVKHFGSDFIESYDDLEADFVKYSQEANKACDEVNSLVFRWAILIYNGIFHKDYNLVDEGLNFFREQGNNSLYKMISDDVNEYKSHIKFDLNKNQFNILFGSNVKKERIINNMSIEEVAGALGITYLAYKEIESGERSTTNFDLFKLTELFKIHADILYIGIRPGAGISAGATKPSGSDRTIDSLDLTSRVYNSLRNNNFKTIKDVLSLDVHQLIAMRSLGKKSVNELLKKMREAGYINWSHTMEQDILEFY
ncbi:MAG: helix-turn-helix domain-containing protein [Defluviitaleaceae bacterium]|nr:helix-turn-helix domain-containing protein [Defluviitaleaceae bacterium]